MSRRLADLLIWGWILPLTVAVVDLVENVDGGIVSEIYKKLIVPYLWKYR